MPRYINEEGLALIRYYEGLSLRAYLCPAGIPTIGYGHTKGVKMGDVITSSQAMQYLLDDLDTFCAVVSTSCTVPLNNNQFAALVSFVYNIGPKSFKSSTLLKKLNKSDYIGASSEFLRWNKANGKPLAGLTKRRSAERDLFMKA